MSYQNEKNTIFLKNSKCSKNINFLVKIIYNILCIIKKVYKFRKLFFLVLNKPFSNPIVSTVQSKTPKNVSKKKKINKNYCRDEGSGWRYWDVGHARGCQIDRRQINTREGIQIKGLWEVFGCMEQGTLSEEKYLLGWAE